VRARDALAVFAAIFLVFATGASAQTTVVTKTIRLVLTAPGAYRVSIGGASVPINRTGRKPIALAAIPYARDSSWRTETKFDITRTYRVRGIFGSFGDYTPAFLHLPRSSDVDVTAVLRLQIPAGADLPEAFDVTLGELLQAKCASLPRASRQLTEMALISEMLNNIAVYQACGAAERYSALSLNALDRALLANRQLVEDRPATYLIDPELLDLAIQGADNVSICNGAQAAPVCQRLRANAARAQVASYDYFREVERFQTTTGFAGMSQARLRVLLDDLNSVRRLYADCSPTETSRKLTCTLIGPARTTRLEALRDAACEEARGRFQELYRRNCTP
jgi:hypothetical protein